MINRILLYRHTLHEIPSIAPTIPCDVDHLGESDLPRLREVWRVPLDEMKARLERGDQCFAARVEGQIAHYSWAQFSGWHPINAVGQRVEVQPGNVWVYHCRTAEWARGRGIYPFVLTRILNESTSRNCRAAWIYAEMDNAASIRGIEKAGFSIYKKLLALNLFGRKFPIVRA